MKHIILIFLSAFLINLGLAQNETDTTYFNYQHEEVHKNDDALYYRIYIPDSKGFVKTEEYYMDNIKMSTGQVISLKNKIRIGLHKYYFKNGELAEQGYFSSDKKIGVWTKYFENGQLKEKSEYLFKGGGVNYIPKDIWNKEGVQTLKDGTGEFIEFYNDLGAKGYGQLVNSKKTGTWIGFYNSGEKYYEEIYSNDSLFSGFSFDRNGNKYNYSKLIQLAEFDDSQGSFQDYFSKNINLSMLDKASYPPGSTLGFLFTIESDGSITNIKPEYNIDNIVDQEIVRMIKSLPKWKPSLYRGMPKKYSFIIPVTIK